MAYAAVADLIARFGVRELIQLTDRAEPPTDQVDDAVACIALNAASQIVDSHVSVKYNLPLAQVDPLLVDITCDIARFRLYSTQATELVIERNKQALESLKRIAAGTMKIDVGGVEPESRTTVILAQSDPRRFSRRTERNG